MLYLVPLPIIIIAVVVKVVSDKYKLKIFSTISKVVIAIGVVLFIYFFAVAKGFDIIEIIRRFFTL